MAEVSIDDVAISEGQAGTKLLIFTVSRSDNLGAFTLKYGTTGITAIGGSDYSTKGGVMYFTVGGGLTQTIAVSVKGDTYIENDETFALTLSSLSSSKGTAVFTKAVGVGTIINDDFVPPATVTIGDVTLTEGASGTKTATFTITRSNNKGSFTVDFATADGTATAGTDYVARSGTVSFFASGASSATVAVTVLGDPWSEADEGFTLNLSNLVNTKNSASIGDSSGTATIRNDDGSTPGVASVADAAGLSAALTTALGGESLMLASGNYGDVRLANINPAAMVTVRPVPGATPVLGELQIANSSNLSIGGLEIANTSFATEYEYAVLVDNSRNIELVGLDVHGSLDGDSWNDARGLRILNASDVLVTGSTFHDLAVGTIVENSQAAVIGDNDYSVLREGIDIMGSSGVLIDRNLLTDIRPNTNTGDHSDAIQVFTGATYAGSSDLTFSNNAVLKGSGDYTQGLFIASQQAGVRHSNILIENNLYSGISAHGITVGDVDGAVVRGNTVVTAPEATWDARINIDRSAGVSIERNIFSGASETASTNTLWNENIDAHSGGVLDATSIEALLLAPLTPGTRDVGDFAVVSGSLAAAIGAGADVVTIESAGDVGAYTDLLDLLGAGGRMHHIV